MRKFALMLLLLPVFCAAQNKPHLEVGGVGGFFPKDDKVGYGGNIGFNASLNDQVAAGVGFMPVWMKDNKKPFLPLYADVRIRIDRVASLMLQPGYNFYKNGSTVNLPNVYVNAKTEGGFYGAAGLAINVPTETNTGFYVHAKYNYFAFNSTVDTRANGGNQRSSSKSHSSAITLGVGLRLQ